MSARMIFPGFPPQKKNNDDEFRPEIYMNRGQNDSSNLNKITNTGKNNLSEEEDENLNKIVIDRPVVKNKKKQKIKKMVLEDSKTNKVEEKTSNDNIISIDNSRKIENEVLIENKKIEENRTEKSVIIEKNQAAEITTLNEGIEKVESIIYRSHGI